jgi:molecular chaperone GrpE
MAEPKEDMFLDDPESIEAEIEAALADEDPIDIAAEPDLTEPGLTELELLQAERDELKDRLLRTLAESENVRKRADRDRREAEQYGSARLSRDLLPVYDNLYRALEAANKEENEVEAGVIEGVELTLRELLNVFSKHGMSPVVPEVGDAFNPQEHEAMFEAPLPGTKKGEIIQVMAVGFLLHDRLLRPAQVGVSSNPGS